MYSLPTNARAALLALLLAAVLTPAAAAQAPRPRPGQGAQAREQLAAEVPVYRREVFRYQRGGRPDPYQPLLNAADLGYRIEDLRLTAIIYSPNPRQSVAVFALADSARRFRLRAGQRLGSITVLNIYPRRVDVRVDDFGVGRIESVQLQRAQRQQAAAAAEAALLGGNTAQVPVTITSAPAPQQPTGPLRRGGAPAPAGQAAPAQRGGTTRRGTTTTQQRPSVLGNARPTYGRP